MRKLFVLIAAVAFVVAYTVPAVAAEWNFYGSARMTTFVDDVTPAGVNVEDDDDLTWALQGNSRIGATVKAGAIGGGFEYGSGPNLRKLYGTWNFGGGQLLVGQTYSPVNMFYSNQVWGSDTDMLCFGGVYGGRNPMLQLKFGNFKIAALSPKTANITPSADVDTTMPKLEASYSVKAGPVGLALQGGYNSYDEAGANTYSVDSYIVALGFNAGLGAAYIKGDIYTGTNLGPYGMFQRGADDPVYDAVNDSVVDNDSMGYLAVVGFKVSDGLSFEVGYGHTESELDVDGADADETDAYYAQAVINLAKGCFIVPEFGKIDNKEENTGETTYYGAKWQINF